MLLDDANHKLDEANFFLNKAKLSLTNPIELSFYLSAFFSAARSVTFVLQKELKNNKNKKFLNWYKEKQIAIGKDKILQLFNRLRNITIHEKGGVLFNRKVNLTINENIRTNDCVNFSVIRKGKIIRASPAQIDEKLSLQVNTNSTPETIDVEVFLDNAPNEEGIKLCSQYLIKLYDLIHEAERIRYSQ